MITMMLISISFTTVLLHIDLICVSYSASDTLHVHGSGYDLTIVDGLLLVAKVIKIFGQYITCTISIDKTKLKFLETHLLESYHSLPNFILIF